MNPEQLLSITEQLILLSAFLGGFSATFLAAILVFNPKQRLANWAVVLCAVSASSFIVCATSSVALVNGLQASPAEIENNLVSLQAIRIISGLSMALGLFSLLANIGLAGWLRNRACGVATTATAASAALFVAALL